MYCLSNFLYQLFHIWGVLHGYSYTTVDVKNNVITFNTYLKIYAYLQNIFMLCIDLYCIENSMESYSPDLGLSYTQVIYDTITAITIILLIILRIREERTYEQIYKTLITSRKLYFEKTDKTIEMIQILQIFIILSFEVHRFIEIVDIISLGSLEFILTESSVFLNTSLGQYVLWHHALILNYFNTILLNINKQLENDNAQEPFSEIYIKISLVMEQLNSMNSPIVFTVFLYILTKLAANMFGVFGFGLRGVEYYPIIWYCIGPQLIVIVNIYLYYLICNRVNDTIQDTQRILREYNEKQQNKEV